MKIALLLPAVLGSLLAGSAHAAVLAGWNFETNIPPTVIGAASGPTIAAETGSGSFQGVHASSATTWESAVGNGSLNSYVANTWTTGDYFQFSTSSTGYEDITISLDHVSTPNAPRDFQLSYSTDGTNYTDFGSVYAIQKYHPTNFTWNSSTPTPLSLCSFDLSGIAALENATTIYFRISQVGTATTGGGAPIANNYSKVDNVTINGTAIVPEPCSALLGAIGVLGLLRRRR